jgi:hypothetical protein
MSLRKLFLPRLFRHAEEHGPCQGSRRRRRFLLLLLLILLHSQVAAATMTHSLLHFYDPVTSTLSVGHVC